MANKVIYIKSIAELHKYYDCTKPKHSLVSVIDLATLNTNLLKEPVSLQMDLYIIACKKFKGQLTYGRTHYDFEDGSLLFTSPGQILSSSLDAEIQEGWALFFHPDLLYSTMLGKIIHRYSFFLYDLNEALHVSNEEKLILQECIHKIKREYEQNVDKHTHGLIVSNIELMLNYCDRFYDRQFYTRAKPSKDLVQRFELLLNEYFTSDTTDQHGIPEVNYFASRLSVSAKYLADVLHKFTGKTTQEHIHLKLIEKAKALLWSTDLSISEIAYRLGFEHAPHFTKMFKAKTGKTPSFFRNLN
jgi:AraC-like DNA-binding protein